MAGLGRKIFNSGDILLASEVQGFLQDQAVMVFDDDAARTAAIPTPTEGMVTFRKDDNALEVFDGSTFVAVGGGSEPGLVHIVQVSDTAVSSLSVNDCFSSDYKNYKIIVTYQGASTNSNDNFRFRVSGSDNTTSNYNNVGFLTRIASSFNFGGTSLTSFANFFNHSTNARESFSMNVYTPFASEKSRFDLLGFSDDGVNILTRFVGGVFDANDSFTGFTLICISGTFSLTIDVFGYED